MTKTNTVKRANNSSDKLIRVSEKVGLELDTELLRLKKIRIKLTAKEFTEQAIKEKIKRSC